MLSLSPLAHSMQFANPRPGVKVMDVREDVTNLTTYTFTSCYIGDLGGTASTSGDVYGTHPNVRSSSRKAIAVIVHGEDATATFGINSVTIGAVAGTERVDRGGGTSPINTAIYTWDTDSLQGITSTDIVVTFSEAVTACAIGVLQLENIALLRAFGTGSAVGTGVLSVASGGTLDGNETNLAVIVATTCATGGGTELPDMATDSSLNTASTTTAVLAPRVMLYERSNAEIDYAAYYTWVYGYSIGGANVQVSWSGTGAGDAVLMSFS